MRDVSTTHTLRLAALAWIFVSACTTAAWSDDDSASVPQPYDFRGFHLGMSLAEFRQERPPVKGPDKAAPNCLRMTDVDDAARSVVRCTWLRRTADRKIIPATIAIGDVPAREYSFVFFASHKGGERELRQITLALPGAARARAFKRLSEKFGPPATPEVDDNLWSARWDNGVSTICLKSSVADASTTITFLLKPEGC